MTTHTKLPWVLGLVAACGGDGTAATVSETDADTSSESSMTSDDPTATSPTTTATTDETTTDDPSTTSPTTTASTTDDTSGSETTTDTSSSDGSTSTGDTDTASSSESSSSSAGETESDTDTGGNQIGECVDACEAGCTDTLLWSHTGEVTTHHSGTRIATLDDAGRLALWNADDLSRIAIALGVDWAAIAGNTFVYDTGGSLQLASAIDGTVLGSITDAQGRGIATGGGYVWTASGAALSVYEADGTLRFAIAGDYSDALVLAMPDALHVFAPGIAADLVTRIDAADESESTIGFEGEFDGWFADAPQFWTRAGQAYRAYDAAGVELAFEIGTPVHGWGSRLVLLGQFGTAEVVDVSDPETVIADLQWSYQISGPAVLSVTLDDAPTITRLDADPITTDVVAPVCCVTEFSPWSFAFADEQWVVGGSDGSVADDQGNNLVAGQFEFLAGSSSGRAGVADSHDLTHIWDIGGDCSVTEYDPFPKPSARFWIAGGGSALAGHERWVGAAAFSTPGMRLYSLPDGALVGESGQGISSDTNVGGAIAGDSGLFARVSYNNDVFFYHVTAFPSLEVMHTDFGDVVPSLAPDSSHVVLSDGITGPFDTLEGAQSYVFDPAELVATFEGVTRGFIDDDRLLVEHYTNDGGCGFPSWECDELVATEIVDLDGVVIQPTVLPIIREFERISPTEVLAVEHATIYDVYTGLALWVAPDGFAAAVAGPDHVIITDGAMVQALRWR